MSKLGITLFHMHLFDPGSQARLEEDRRQLYARPDALPLPPEPRVSSRLAVVWRLRHLAGHRREARISERGARPGSWLRR